MAYGRSQIEEPDHPEHVAAVAYAAIAVAYLPPHRDFGKRVKGRKPQSEEERMNRRWMIGTASASLLFTGVVLAGPVAAAEKKKVDTITCEEFLAMNPDDQQRIAYWVDGYQTAKGEAAVGVVAFDKFGQPIGALVDDCKKTPKETLWEKLKKHL
jgi:hypothetical protein